MKNKKFSGHNIPYTATADRLSGDVIIKGEFIGISSGDVLNTEEGTMDTTGVYELAKEAAVVFAQGDKVYFDPATKECTADNLDTEIGVAYQAQVGGDANCLVRLLGGAGSFN